MKTEVIVGLLTLLVCGSFIAWAIGLLVSGDRTDSLLAFIVAAVTFVEIQLLRLNRKLGA